MSIITAFIMRVSARAIILQNKKVLLIHRFKEGIEYYVIPGGGVEPDETPDETVKREIMEELSLDITINTIIENYTNKDNSVIYYLVTSFKGNVSINGPEKIKMQEDPTNRYIPEWVNIDNIDLINLVQSASTISFSVRK